MSPGSILTLRIPATGTLVRHLTWESINNLGAAYWTDGYIEGPMYVEQSSLRKASDSQELFWIDECEEVSRRPMGAKAPEDSANIAVSEEPTVDDFRNALRSGVANTPKKERFIRLRLWWAANDPVRTGKQPAPDDSDWAENLEAFIALLDQDNDDERLVLAEIAREVGDFSAALQLLEGRDDDFSQFLRALIQKNDTNVRKIVLPAEGGGWLVDRNLLMVSTAADATVAAA